jgi:hypothetical protein
MLQLLTLLKDFINNPHIRQFVLFFTAILVYSVLTPRLQAFIGTITLGILVVQLFDHLNKP